MQLYKRVFLSILIPAVLFVSCEGKKTAQIWTDRPEFAVYGELFNNAQNQYKVSVKYYENPGNMLEKTRNTADIVIGSWLKNNSTGNYFKSLDNLFGANKLPRSVFYEQLLAVGRINRNQYLMPVSFNIPALIFSKERELELQNQFTINFDEIKSLSKGYNTINRGAYTRMGFSPLWSRDFLMIVTVLSGTSFREASPLTWDTAALEKAMDFVNNWTIEINTSNQAEEDFTFKYFVEPPERLVINERILFSYMNSMDFFSLNRESRNNLDYRWIMEQNRIPINEDIVLLGIPKRAKSAKTARAFIRWFFTMENQELILNYCAETRINETVFGLCGGFSALSPVTEEIFPRFYPEISGRMPPSEYLLAPNVLPGNWADIKERVIIPYLTDRSRTTDISQIIPLEKRLADWIKINR